jgi:hypothetical protein
VNHCSQTINVRFWHLADIELTSANVRFGGKADTAYFLQMAHSVKSGDAPF